MSFLYLFNVLFYFVVNILMGRVRDAYVSSGGDLYQLFVNIGAIPMTIGGIIIFSSTFIPIGSLSVNPKVPGNGFGAQVTLLDNLERQGTIVVVEGE